MANELISVPWPDWEVVRRLDEGSFSAVYEIRRTLPGGQVEKCALKKRTASGDWGMEELVRRYSLMQSLSGCPNIVSCYDIRYIQHEDNPGWDIYIRMELLQPLKEALGGFSEEAAVELGMQLCNALTACHAENIICLSIKPENILVSGKGVFKLGDFGTVGVSAGIDGYKAPEVTNHQHCGATADIYSLGMVLYWMMNRRTLPFLPLPPDIPTGVQRQQAQDRRLSGEPLPPPADGSEALKRVVLKACAYVPEERYRSAEEMRLALQDCLRAPARQDAAVLSPLAPLPSIPQAAARQETPQHSMQSLPPIPQPQAAASQTPTQPVHAPTQPVHTPAPQANAPGQKQQRPEQHSHAPAKNANMKQPGKKKPSSGRAVAATVIAIVLIGCCWVGIFGYMHCWFGHVWQAEDCTTGRICTRCSAVAAEPLGHVWKAATCTTPKTCTRCGETEGAALGHNWEAATCTSPKTCTRCGETEGTALGHKWEAATCTSPKTCSLCGETEGTALGHTWEAATCTSPKTCSLCGETEGAALGHSWEAATCTSPKTYSLCGKTEGIALGHTWEAATCILPKTCSICNKTEGTALGHTWKSATCTTPKTCSRCKKTSGAALGHSWRAATYDAPKTCTVCGTTTGTALKRTPSVEAGDIVTFGKYEQDNNKTNGAEAIRWIVLDVQDDRALLLSRYALDSVRYHSSYVDVGWRDCSLRSWLNDTFLYTAFSAEDRRRIVTTYDTGASDSVFLLSVGEVYYYLSSARDRTCSLTSYAAAMGAAEKNNVAQWWWTRSPGTEAGQTTFINFEGDSYSAYVNNYSLAVRPAIWISLD